MNRKKPQISMHLNKNESALDVLIRADMEECEVSGFLFTDETVQVVFVEAEKAGDAHTEPNELIEVFELPIAAIPEFLSTNPLPIGTRAQLVLESFIQ